LPQMVERQYGIAELADAADSKIVQLTVNISLKLLKINTVSQSSKHAQSSHNFHTFAVLGESRGA
jgi:hypothetical protein